MRGPHPTAEATQAVGALLLLGLLAAPAGAAQRLTASPYLGLALSAALATVAVWLGVTVSYLVPSLPPSTAVVASASAIYPLAFALTARRGSRGASPGSPRRAAID